MLHDETRELTLGDLGESRILNEIVLPTLGRDCERINYGSDCGYLDLEHDGTLVVTTDYAPQPAVWNCGFPSYRTWGYYAVLINVSDLAASGCEPIGFVSSIDAPSSMKVGAFLRFILGIREACDSLGINPAGGNIRQAKCFACHGTAIGIQQPEEVVTRAGAKCGDVLCSVGPCGEFIAAFLEWRQGKMSSEIRRRLLRPSPQTSAMRELVRRRLVSAASDNSDGVLGSVWNILEQSGVRAILEMTEDLPVTIQEVARRNGFDPWNLMYCWGDWNVIAAIPENMVGEANDLAHSLGQSFRRLGRVVEGQPALLADRGNGITPMRLLRNENFTGASFNANVEDHLTMMLASPLVCE